MSLLVCSLAPSAGKRGLIRKALLMRHRVMADASGQDAVSSRDAGGSGASGAPYILFYDFNILNGLKWHLIIKHNLKLTIY